MLNNFLKNIIIIKLMVILLLSSTIYHLEGKSTLQIKNKSYFSSQNKLKLKNNLKSHLKNNTVKQYQFDKMIYDIAPQIKDIGPVGMYADLSQPLRMQNGYLVPDDEEHLPKEYLAIRNRIMYKNAKKLSAKPIEMGDSNEGMFVTLWE